MDVSVEVSWNLLKQYLTMQPGFVSFVCACTCDVTAIPTEGRLICFFICNIWTKLQRRWFK